VGVILDLQGPRIRTGRLKHSSAKIEKGRDFIITAKQVDGNESQVSTDFSSLPSHLKPGQKILLDNGLIELQVTKISGSDIHCRVYMGGILGEHKGINIPGVSIFKKALTEKDKEDISTAVLAKADYIALSFVKSPDDILEAKKIIHNDGGHIPVIAKIENSDALKRLDAIINVSDAIMVARGDLGVELLPEEVPIIQKNIIKKCAKAGKPVIVASQMLESMVENPRPTRAESTDVANAIFDGADAVMLSEETASGLYPIESVEMMVRIIQRAEEEGSNNTNLSEDDIRQNTAFVVSHAAAEMCEELKAKAVISFTSSGSTALMVSKWKPKAPIFASVTSVTAARRVSLYWGVLPILMEKFNNTDEMIENVEKAAVSGKLLKKGDLVVITAGVPIGQPGTTNLIKVHKIG
jgi:pyruvate kinase